jgi:hypothetical protein
VPVRPEASTDEFVGCVSHHRGSGESAQHLISSIDVDVATALHAHHHPEHFCVKVSWHMPRTASEDIGDKPASGGLQHCVNEGGRIDDQRCHRQRCHWRSSDFIS